MSLNKKQLSPNNEDNRTYYVCNEDNVAFPAYYQVIGHWNMAHKGETQPGK